MIGGGGMGKVFSADDLKSPGNEVAVKFMSLALGGNDDAIVRFNREAKAMQALSGHRNIVQIYDDAVIEGESAIVMELLPGQSLDKRIAQGPMPIGLAIDIITQVLEGVHHAHNNFSYEGRLQPIIHRDLKPTNIMLLPDGTVKILDFGIAKIIGPEFETLSSSLQVGTYQYMSPEQVGADEEARKPNGIDAKIGHTTDLYSVGIIFYEMLCGKPPFTGGIASLINGHLITLPTPPRVLNSAIPEHVDRAIMKALEKNTRNRFAGAHEFIEAIKKPGIMPPDPENFCQKCRARIAPGQYLCSSCAVIPPSTNKCSRCDVMVIHDQWFCNNCYKPLKKEFWGFVALAGGALLILLVAILL